MCRVLKVEHSEFYAWLVQHESARAREDARLKPSLIETGYLESGGVHGRRNNDRDLKEWGKGHG
jgi:hypothetical protein